MSKQLINITGLPGSGKSTLARELAQALDAFMVSADDYFTVFNPYLMKCEYVFDPKRLASAHEDCQRDAELWLSDPENGATATVIVHNTGSRGWERAVYRAIAQRQNAKYTEIYVNSGLSDAELAARNIHGVSKETITKMRERWEF